MAQRGDVVMVDFPFPDVPGAKRRPSLIIQNDHDNQRIRKTVNAMITGNLARKGDPSHLFIDPATAEGISSGLRIQSLVSCNNIYTIDQASIVRTLGHLSNALKQQLKDCLKAALEIF